MYEIHKGVPVPALKRTSKYPFDAMEVGDCFYVPVGLTKTIRSAAVNFGRRHGWRFTTRLLDDGQLGVWRTG